MRSRLDKVCRDKNFTNVSLLEETTVSANEEMITATEVTRNLKQLSDSFQGHFSIKKPGMARK